MAHAQCTKQLSRLRPSAHAFISCVASTLQWPASTFRGNKQREILKSSNGMKTFDLQAFALHGSRCMLTHFSHFSGANIAATKHLQPTSIDAAAWIPGQRSGLADMLAHWTQKQRAHPRGTCERAGATGISTSVVLPAEATSTRIPPAPGLELLRHVRQLPVDSDAADLYSPISFLPCSIYLRYLFPPTPPSCVYQFLWERTVSIILYTFNFPFLIYSLYLSGGPIPWSK